MKTARTVASGVWFALKLFVGLIFLIVVYQCTAGLNNAASKIDLDKAADRLAGTTTTTTRAAASCSVSDITIKSQKARFQDGFMRGVAVLVNGCAEPIGVQVKITGLDKAGAPVASRDLWPASINNIPPGEYTFSLDSYLDHNPAMKRFILEPVSVKRWP